MTNPVKDGQEEEIGRGEGAITGVCAPCRPFGYKVLRMGVPAICSDMSWTRLRSAIAVPENESLPFWTTDFAYWPGLCRRRRSIAPYGA